MLEQHRRIIVMSKHLGVALWLRDQHPEIADRAVYDPYARPKHIRGAAVISSFPLYPMTEAEAYYDVAFRIQPTRPDLTAQEMRDHGAYLRRVYVLDDQQLQMIRAQAVHDHIRATEDPA